MATKKKRKFHANMAAIIITLDKRRANDRGDYPVKFIINAGKTNAAISVNISLPSKSWLGNGLERPVKTSYPGAKLINDQIQALYIEFSKRISDLELSILFLFEFQAVKIHEIF